MRNPYDDIAGQWHAQARAFREQKYVDMLLRWLRPGARVLDLGCGTGKPVARYLIEKGFSVVGVDLSTQMLEIAARVVPEAELIHGDMLRVELRGPFSAVIAWDSVFHVGREHHQTLFRRLYEWLEPGGGVLLSSGGSGAEELTSEMFGHTFSYSGFEPEVTLSLLGAEGFEVDFWEVDDPSSRGHIAVVARKAAPTEAK